MTTINNGNGGTIRTGFTGASNRLGSTANVPAGGTSTGNAGRLAGDNLAVGGTSRVGSVSNGNRAVEQAEKSLAVAFLKAQQQTSSLLG